MGKSRIKVPTVLQMEAAECGAASLTMILKYYGKHVPLEQVRVQSGVSRDGSKASNILKAARHYGLEAKGYRKEPDRLKDMSFPLIIHWNFCHYVVLEDYGKKIYINDPASGRRIVTEEEFNQSFTGVTLAFSPSPEFQRDGKKSSIISILIQRLNSLKAALLYVVLLGLTMVIPGLILPVFSRTFIDDVLLRGKVSWIIPLLLGMGFTALFRGIIELFQKHILLKMETKIAVTDSSRFLWHVLRLPAVFFTQRSAGDIATRMQSNDRIAKFLSDKLTTAIVNMFMIIFYFLLMLRYNIILAMVGAAIAFLNILYLKFVSKHRKDSSSLLLKDRGLLLSTGMSGLQIIETIKAMGSETDFFAKWSGYQAKALNSEQKLGVSTKYIEALPVFLTGLNNTVVLTIGAFFILGGEMTIGILVAIQSLMESFMAPIKDIVGQIAVLQGSGRGN